MPRSRLARPKERAAAARQLSERWGTLHREDAERSLELQEYLWHFGLQLLPLATGVYAIRALFRGETLTEREWWSIGAVAVVWVGAWMMRYLRRRRLGGQ